MIEMYSVQGESRRDCELKIREKYNRDYKILTEKEIRAGGFLGLFSKPKVEVQFYFTPLQQLKFQQAYSTHNVPAVNADGSIQNLEEEKRKVLDAAYKQSLTGKSYDTISANGKEASQQILDSLNELKERLDSAGKKGEHPSFTRAAEILKSNDFSDSYIKKLLEKLRKEMPLEDLDNFDKVQENLVIWIGESISIYKDEQTQRKPKIMALVGPTGVGKTTTIAKLAAIYGLGIDDIKPVDVRIITIDNFRICAKEQIETMGSIMQIEVSFVTGNDISETKQSLRKEIAKYSSETDLFLIDTIGNSPRDASKLGIMKEILDGAGRNVNFHLAVSAATKTSDIEDIMRQFEPFNYKSVILTKMDETYRIGNIISALAEKKKSVSYITDGQTPPGDIKKASVVNFLINLDGLKIDREKIEERFPQEEEEETDQFNWG